MQVESLDEFVKVRADFSGGSVRPLMFRTFGAGRVERVFRVERVNATWTEREGSSSRVCFSVQAEGATYFLSLVLPDMIWRAEEVVLEG